MSRRAPRLVDVERTPRRIGTTTDLVHVPADTCPSCGGPTTGTDPSWQPALFWLHGFGAATVEHGRSCPACGWRLHSATTTARPT